jgi:hypothetical protein
MRDMRDSSTRNGEPYPIEEPDQSLGDLTGRLTAELGALFNDHLQLARLDITHDLKKAGKTAGLMGGAAAAGWIAALVLSLALAWGLAELMETWIAFLIVGVAWAIAAAVMGMAGRRNVEETDWTPEQTIHEIERDKQWMREQRN